MGWVIAPANEWEDYSAYFRGGGFSGDGPLPTFWSLVVGLRTVLSAVPFSLLICEACILRVKVWLKLTGLSSWTYFVLNNLCCVLGPCHSFEACPLLSFLLFHTHKICP